MDQAEKNLRLNLEELADLPEYYERQIREGEFDIAYDNLWRAATTHFDSGLIRWRRGESPVADFEAVLELGERLRKAEIEWSSGDLDIADQNDQWLVVLHSAYLLSKPEPLSAERIEIISKLRSDVHDVLLEFKIVEALAGRPWREGFEDLITCLGSKKRQVLSAHTYRTYFDLLDAKGQSNDVIEPLIREAETNYDKRRRDAFFGGGPTYMGGGPDNPYVVDFTLAAIMKHLDWQGESIHRWKW